MTNSISAQATAAQTAANVAAANAAAAGLTGSGSAAGSSSPSTALASLSDNFQGFLQMLMTQLKNQDPTAPMDSSKFTSELVQFSSVEQQINTNTNLTNLIQMTQGNTMVQSGQLLGKHVEVKSDQLSLQQGSASIAFTAPVAGPVAVAIYNAAGKHIFDATVTAAAGDNTWTWNGQTATGTQAPDGAYKVAVAGTALDGTTATLPFSVLGAVTGVQAQGSGVQLQLGQLAVDMSALESVGN